MLWRDEFLTPPVLQVRIDADASAALERRHIVNEFVGNVERHRRELLLHCYCMLGSLPNTEDAGVGNFTLRLALSRQPEGKCAAASVALPRGHERLLESMSVVWFPASSETFQ